MHSFKSKYLTVDQQDLVDYFEKIKHKSKGKDQKKSKENKKDWTKERNRKRGHQWLQQR